MNGRFAPSPTGDLHVGNLRTALLASLAASSTDRGFLVRMEDLDRVTSSPENERRQLDDLAAIGIEWQPPVMRQSERFDLYRSAIGRLRDMGRVYECYCTRREIAAAASAPHTHLPDGAYPGTCRELTAADRVMRQREGRRPALRLMTDGESIEVDDVLCGRYVGAVDDVVLARGDGVPAYNLAVVVDDALQEATQVVRGDDLLSSTPRQILLQRLLGYPMPEYWHVGLVLGPDGQRLAKRHGAVTLPQLRESGWTGERLRSALLRSLGQVGDGALDVGSIPRGPVQLSEVLA